MTKPILLLLPGLLCDATVWEMQLRDLAAQADCRVANYGSLDSLTAMARHVLAMAPGVDFSLAGHSMGGRVALEVVRLAPRRVRRLALLDTGYQPLAAGAPGEQERAGRMALLERARSAGMRAMGRVWARGMVHPQLLDTPVFEAILDMIARSTPAIFEAQINALLNRPDASGLLPSIAVPTLVACGRDDQWSPLSRHEEMAAAIPGAQLDIIEQSGHMATMEQPAAVSRALAAWMSSSVS